jgi:2-phospho-L-lactate transferase/gluconeogenesis factor (CofD/UPF0052 family)
MVEALRAARGKVVYVCNTTTQPGQTDGYSALDHVRRVVELVGPGVIDAALINRGAADPATVDHYAGQGLHLLRPDDAEIEQIAALGVRPIARDLAEKSGERRALWNKLDTIRHDPAALRGILEELLEV